MTYLNIFVTDKSEITVEHTHVIGYDIRENCVFITKVNETTTIIPLSNINEIKVKR